MRTYGPPYWEGLHVITQLNIESIPTRDQARALKVVTHQSFNDKQRWIELRIASAPTGSPVLLTRKVVLAIVGCPAIMGRSIVIYGKMAPAQHLARSWRPSAEQCRAGSVA
jgi:hypothetical protein